VRKAFNRRKPRPQVGDSGVKEKKKGVLNPRRCRRLLGGVRRLERGNKKKATLGSFSKKKTPEKRVGKKSGKN